MKVRIHGEFNEIEFQCCEIYLQKLYEDFTTYCIKNGYKPMANKTLKKRMQLYKYDFLKNMNGQRTWVYMDEKKQTHFEYINKCPF